MLPGQTSAAVRAILGFGALQLNDPGRWRDISERHLSFTNPDGLPLAQLYGTHDDGLIRLLITHQRAQALGFTARDYEDAVGLLWAWRDLLKLCTTQSALPRPREEIPS